MRFNLLSSFAAGIFIATGICGAVYFSDNGNAAKATAKTNEAKAKVNVKAQPSESEMKNKLTEAGYIVQTKAEYDKQLKKATKGTDQKTATPANDPNKAVTRVIINVADGMTSIDVGRMLEAAQMVPNAFNFSKDIESKGLQNSLRAGVYTVDSSMTYDQVVSTIFKK
jgi:cell division protein YceG involved in septum cleavage